MRSCGGRTFPKHPVRGGPSIGGSDVSSCHPDDLIRSGWRVSTGMPARHLFSTSSCSSPTQRSSISLQRGSYKCLSDAFDRHKETTRLTYPQGVAAPVTVMASL